MKAEVVDGPIRVVELVNEGELENLLQRRLGNRIRNLEVRIVEKSVILSGRAPTYHAKQLAQHAAMDLCPLPILANNIEVC